MRNFTCSSMRALTLSFASTYCAMTIFVASLTSLTIVAQRGSVAPGSASRSRSMMRESNSNPSAIVSKSGSSTAASQRSRTSRATSRRCSCDSLERGSKTCSEGRSSAFMWSSWRRSLWTSNVTFFIVISSSPLRSSSLSVRARLGGGDAPLAGLVTSEAEPGLGFSTISASESLSSSDPPPSSEYLTTRRGSTSSCCSSNPSNL